MNMQGLTVCVGYDDYLRVTLPRNRLHFDRVVVITAPGEHATIDATHRWSNVICYETDAFYRNGADFNKGLAVEEGLDLLGRDGWLCVFDADIVMPNTMDLSGVKIGKLYCPPRRQLEDGRQWANWMNQGDWKNLPYVADCEYGGYFHLFHGSDPALGPPPWYGTDWKHAGGYDSTFIAHWKGTKRPGDRHSDGVPWPAEKRVLPFDVLHLGPPGLNWHGRQTRRLDGTIPAGSATAKERTELRHQHRRRFGDFRMEKLG